MVFPWNYNLGCHQEVWIAFSVYPLAIFHNSTHCGSHLLHTSITQKISQVLPHVDSCTFSIFLHSLCVQWQALPHQSSTKLNTLKLQPFIISHHTLADLNHGSSFGTSLWHLGLHLRCLPCPFPQPLTLRWLVHRERFPASREDNLCGKRSPNLFLQFTFPVYN